MKVWFQRGSKDFFTVLVRRLLLSLSGRRGENEEVQRFRARLDRLAGFYSPRLDFGTVVFTLACLHRAPNYSWPKTAALPTYLRSGRK